MSNLTSNGVVFNSSVNPHYISVNQQQQHPIPNINGPPTDTELMLQSQI
jgi:hypothetical protein